MKRVPFKSLAGILLLLSASQPVQAAWSTATGHIVSVSNSAGGNYAFRVQLDVTFPGCTANFAFLNTTDDNYQAKVATLLTIYAMNKPVQIQFTPITGGFCQIMDIVSQ